MIIGRPEPPLLTADRARELMDKHYKEELDNIFDVIMSAAEKGSSDIIVDKTLSKHVRDRLKDRGFKVVSSISAYKPRTAINWGL
jgi:phage terminase large subunit-like protein